MLSLLILADAVLQCYVHSVVGAQVLECPVQQFTQFSILVLVHSSLEFREDGFVERLVTLAAKCLEPAAISNPHQPGRDACIAAEVACLPPGDPETVIDDFLDDVLAPRQACKEPAQPPVIAVVQRGQRRTVALPHSMPPPATVHVRGGLGYVFPATLSG